MPNIIFKKLANLYSNMESAYTACANEAELSCQNCQTNCCTSYFQHHTYVEWAYLWRGLFTLSLQSRQQYIEKAHEYITGANRYLANGLLPDMMCPLNDNGLCAIYSHRLMICRLHGTRNCFILPSGETRIFSGCVIFTQKYSPSSATDAPIPTLDRTPFYKQLALLEIDFLRKSKKTLQRVNLSIAEMIAAGAPRL